MIPLDFPPLDRGMAAQTPANSLNLAKHQTLVYTYRQPSWAKHPLSLDKYKYKYKYKYRQNCFVKFRSMRGGEESGRKHSTGCKSISPGSHIALQPHFPRYDKNFEKTGVKMAISSKMVQKLICTK